MKNSIIEIWQAVPGFEGLYEASDLGRIKSLNYNHTGKTEVMKPEVTSSGYLRLGLRKKGEKQKRFLVQRLIYSVFHGPIPDGMTVDHVNNDKRDNRLENLQLLTRGDNARKSNLGKPSALKDRKLSEEHKAKISAAKKGKTSWNKGKTHSEDTKAKMRAAALARHQREKNQE